MQRIIDESFKNWTFPLHEYEMQGDLYSRTRQHWYSYVGQSDYMFGESTVMEEIESLIKMKQKRDLSILDLGTGIGRFMRVVHDRFPDTHPIGISATDMRRLPGCGEPDVSDQEYLTGNIENLFQIQQIWDRKFDMIVSAWTFTHLVDPIGTLCQAYECLNPDGVIILDYCPFRFNPDNIPKRQQPLMLLKDRYTFEETIGKYDAFKLWKKTDHLELPIYYEPDQAVVSEMFPRGHRAGMAYSYYH